MLTFGKSLLVLATLDLVLTQIEGSEYQGEAVKRGDEMKCVCDGDCENVLEGDCLWGRTLDVCGCCFICARGDGEPCGGVHGTCALGYRCHLDQLRRPPADSKAGTCQKERRRGRRR